MSSSLSQATQSTTRWGGQPGGTAIRPELTDGQRPPMTRLIGVELRKMTDTRAGLWLLVAIGVITAGIIAIFFFAAPTEERTFANFIGVTGSPQGFLLPVLGVLLVTSEWGQRTALTTFTTEPHRGRVLVAKVVAALLFGLAAILIAMVIAALGAALGGAPDPWGNTGPDDIGKLALLQGSGVLQGLAFGMLLLNSAAAIVTYFVLPTVFTIVTSLVSWLRTAQPWIDLGTAQTPLFTGDPMSGEQWAQLAVTSSIWILLPLALGWWRVLRAEVK